MNLTQSQSNSLLFSLFRLEIKPYPFVTEKRSAAGGQTEGPNRVGDWYAEVFRRDRENRKGNEWAVRATGLEPVTSTMSMWHSNQLS